MGAEKAPPAEQARPRRRKRRRVDPARSRPRGFGELVAKSRAVGTKGARSAGQPSSAQRGLMGLVAKASAIVGLITGVVTLVIMLWPDPAPVKSADLAKPSLEPDISFAQFLDRVDQPSEGLADEVLAQRGAFVLFTIEATGYNGVELTLKWELVDMGTGDEIRESDAVTITPAADTDRLRVPAFAPLPEQGGPFVVRAELFDEDRVSLAGSETDEFQRK